MGRILSTVGVAGGLFVSACNTCASSSEPPLAEEAPPFATEDAGGPDLEEREESFSLPKHDWNGVRMMTTEAQVRKTLKSLGFSAKLARNKTYVTYDPFRQIIHLRKKSDDLTSLVLMETERKERVLKNVWGLRLVFLSNRLIQFSPHYFTCPVELVEPDDEYVPAEDMEGRLRDTFGEPNVLDGEVQVVSPGGEEKTSEKACLWEDGELSLIFRKTNEAGIIRYSLIFSSPEGLRVVEKHLSRSLQYKEKKSQPEAINF
jgi:hypothetical protein